MEGMSVDMFVMKLIIRLLERKNVIEWSERVNLEYFLANNIGAPLTEETLDKMLKELD